MAMRDPYPTGFKLDTAGRIIPEETGVIAASCALAGHPPQLTTTQADTQPQPLTCGCGAQRYELRRTNGNR